MNPLVNSMLHPPQDAALDGQGVLGAMQSLSGRGIEGVNPDSSNMVSVSVDSSGDLFSSSKDIPSWMGANPFKDDNGQQHLDYNADQYGFEGLGGTHVFGGPLGATPPGVPGMSQQSQQDTTDHLRDTILNQALKTQQLQKQYQGETGARNEQEDMQGLKMMKPAQGY